MAGGLVSQRNKWSSVAGNWSDEGPPATPSDEDLATFAHFLQQTRPLNRVLILGCTVQLRQLCATLQGAPSVTCVDFLDTMYATTSKRMPASLIEAETFVCADWTALPVSLENFDAVLGDKAVDNVQWDRVPRFFECVAATLRPQGALILHVGEPDPSVAGHSLTILLSRWSQRIASGQASEDSAAAGLWEDLLSASANEEDRYLTLGRFADEYQALRLKDGIDSVSQGLLRRLSEDFGGDQYYWWTRFTANELARSAQEWFQFKDKRLSSDYFASGLQPILHFVRT